MGPKKETIKKENGVRIPSIDDPVNSANWNCAVVMAVERSPADSFVLKDFMEEAMKERRKEVKLINYESFVLKILNDVTNGELAFKYAFLLNFLPIFQEAAEYASNKSGIPVPLLVKVVKAFLFFFKEESLLKIERKASGPPDPIKAMANRPADAGGMEPKTKRDGLTAAKDKKQGGDAVLKVRPPSVSKEDTKLLKRGEAAKEDQCIDDAPENGLFDLYVLLTGFYYPDFALELLKADVPLHGLLCIDTSLSGTKRVSSTYARFQKRTSEERAEEIQHFWDSFLKILWDPKTSRVFKDTIFQVYVPRRLTCEKEKLKEFIYREISYLMYDLSDFKRQLNNYLRHMKLRDVSEPRKLEPVDRDTFDIDELPNECVTIPILLQHLIDVCSEDESGLYINQTVLSDSIDSSTSGSSPTVYTMTESVLTKYGSSGATPIWSQIIKVLGDFCSVNMYKKTKDLDAKYNLEERYCPESISESDISQATCPPQRYRICAPNMEEALDSDGGFFKSCFNKVKKDQITSVVFDYCLYSLLFTRVVCPYGSSPPSDVPPKTQLCIDGFSKKSSNFESIENIDVEMRKPHFTVTVGSRSALKSVPFNLKQTNKDFFSHSQFKIVSPEMLKTSSAPEFHTQPHLILDLSFISDLVKPGGFPENFQLDAFENLREFLGEDVFANARHFDFVEELSKNKMLSRQLQYWENYNCVDYNYSFLTDSLLVILHNRKGSDGTHRETFNEVLKTEIGLRDFFEYVLEDESEWLKSQEELYENKLSVFGKNSLLDGSFKNFTDSTFWMDNSIKQQEYLKLGSPSKREFRTSKSKSSSKGIVKKENVRADNSDKYLRRDTKKESKETSASKAESAFAQPGEPHDFEGYDVSDMVVQYSGVKTVYFAGDSNVTVDLIERLYGDQDLGVHVCMGGHTLHLYSYACPVPHILDPLTFHVSYRSGIFIAFGKRVIETFDEVEEVVEPKMTPSKGKKTSSEMSAAGVVTRTRRISKMMEDKEFFYDMTLSFPNGLSVTVVRKNLRPCYVKQRYLRRSASAEVVRRESTRLFLPDGSVVKIMNDQTVHVLKPNTSTVSTSLSDLIQESDNSETQEENHDVGLKLIRYETMTSDAQKTVFNRGRTVTSKKYSIFQSTDMASKTVFCRRIADGTNYMIQNEEILCVQFIDGTKISSFVFLCDEDYQTNPEGGYLSEEDSYEETDIESDFVFVHSEVTVEHPDYATVVYNSQTRRWKIVLPFDSTITVEQEGSYFVDVDKETELKIGPDLIQMSRFTKAHQLLCSATVDLSVFEKDREEGVYCQVEDSNGKIFVVEANSNCYVTHDEGLEEEAVAEEEKSPQTSSRSVSRSVASNETSNVISADNTDRQVPGFKLSRDKKYFVARRDITGLEIFHKEDVSQIISEPEKGWVVFRQEMPGPEKLRCFVLIGPAPQRAHRGRKWEVPSVLPNPKPDRDSTGATTSSTYGRPPSWMFPFPKRKEKFRIPDQLTCRVFVETKKTNLNPPAGFLECCHCEIDEDDDVAEVRHSKMSSGIENIQKYMKRLSDDDQDVLREMYTLVAREILNAKKITKGPNSEKLEHYLRLSKYYVDLQEYHKKCIRYHEIPNYFHHPKGMAWLILNDWLNKIKFPEMEEQKRDLQSHPSKLSLGSEKTFSNEEVEYNLTVSSEVSFSDLSCRTDISSHTAPAVLRTDNVCTCKIRDPRLTASAPIYKASKHKPPEPAVEEQHKECAFFPEEINAIEEMKVGQPNSVLDALEDLMSLGLL